MTNSDGCGCGSNERLWIPLRSTIQVNNDTSITISAPPGFIYVGYDKKDNLKMATAGTTTVSCTCEVGTDPCSPFIGTLLGTSTAGCAGSCTKCTMTQSAKIGGTITVFKNGGYLNSTQQAEFIQPNQDIPAAFQAMFDLPEVKEEIEKFMKSVYQGLPRPKIKKGENYISVPEGYAFAFVNIFGRAVVLPVPKMATAGGGADTASCSCSGNGGCTLQTSSAGLGGATWCQDNCSATCTLTATKNIGNGAVNVIYAATVYRY